ncbi:hypothetical protein [Planomicrobium sp. Y74]|uniref:hypothetical protein n=1 Tax=Planomicrobium sp. Y74 TaxID=2478977 RepID=UPI0018F2EF52|nr:hypothetical protein [Planomicrobium sp. Y74]
MAIISKLTIILIIAISFALAFLTFYLMSNLTKEQRKQQINEITSQLVNFMLFLWLAKILLNLPLFVQDPLAVLAYPSNSEAFYLAAIFTGILVHVKTKQGKIEGGRLAHTFLQIFLAASFVYEFIQMTWRENPFSLPYLVVFGLLLALFHVLQGRMNPLNQVSIVLAAAAAGFFTINFMLPYLSIFGYIVEPWFLALFLAACFRLLINGPSVQPESESN